MYEHGTYSVQYKYSYGTRTPLPVSSSSGQMDGCLLRISWQFYSITFNCDTVFLYCSKALLPIPVSPTACTRTVHVLVYTYRIPVCRPVFVLQYDYRTCGAILEQLQYRYSTGTSSIATYSFTGTRASIYRRWYIYGGVSKFWSCPTCQIHDSQIQSDYPICTILMPSNYSPS